MEKLIGTIGYVLEYSHTIPLCMKLQVSPPHELIFGTKAIIPSQFSRQEIPRTFVEHLDGLFTKITTRQATAAANLEQAKEKSKLMYDKNVNPRQFIVGDDVYLFREPKKSKFDSSWLGPYKGSHTRSSRPVKCACAGRPDQVDRTPVVPPHAPVGLTGWPDGASTRSTRPDGILNF